MQVDFDPRSGHIRVVDSALPRQASLEGIAWVRYRTASGKTHHVHLVGEACALTDESFSDVHGSGRLQIIRCPISSEEIELTYQIKTYPQSPFVLMQLSLRNLCREPIYLWDFCLLQADPVFGGHLDLSTDSRDLRFFKVGWHGWDYAGLRRQNERNNTSKMGFITDVFYTNPATSRPKSRGVFWSEGWGIFAGSQSALIAGFVSTAHQFGQVHTRILPGSESLMLVTQADGIQLDPGETCESEWGYLQLVALPDPDPAVDFMNAVSRQMNARVPVSPPPPMWTHWYHYYHDISEPLFVQNLQVLTDHKSTIPYQVVELDDGYQAAWGDWTSTNAKFPHGLEWLAAQVRSRGFTPGLWLAPFSVQSSSRIARQHPDWLVKNRYGRPINAGLIYELSSHALDASNPAFLEYLCKEINLITQQWGFGMLKLDFLNAAALPGRRFNPRLTRAECLRLGLETIRQSAGDDTFLLGCGCPFGPAIGIVDAMRIGPDTAPSWKPFYQSLPWIGPLIKSEPSMPSLRNSFRQVLNLSAVHQRWWWNDPDCLLVRDTDTSLTEAEVQSAVTLVGMSGGLIISSDDLRKVNPERLRWVSTLVPNLGLKGLPLDFLDREMPELYQLKLHTDGQDWQVVGLFNWDSQPRDIHLKFEPLGFEPGTMLHVFDFWQKQYYRVTEPEMSFTGIPPHGCKLLRICAVVDGPQLVGDTMHISQGSEIGSLKIEEDRLVIGTIDMGRLVEGELWLWLPQKPALANCNGRNIEVKDKGDGIYSLCLSFVGDGRLVIEYS